MGKSIIQKYIKLNTLVKCHATILFQLVQSLTVLRRLVRISLIMFVK